MNREIFQKAADYLRTVGWRKDGEYGDQDPTSGKVSGPCCVLGAIAAVTDQKPDDVWGGDAYEVIQKTLQEKAGGKYVSVVDWNDEQASAEPVIALLEELAGVPQ